MTGPAATGGFACPLRHGVPGDDFGGGAVEEEDVLVFALPPRGVETSSRGRRSSPGPGSGSGVPDAGNGFLGTPVGPRSNRRGRFGTVGGSPPGLREPLFGGGAIGGAEELEEELPAPGADAAVACFGGGGWGVERELVRLSGNAEEEELEELCSLLAF